MGILINNLASVGQMHVSIGQMMYVCATNAIARVMLGRRVLGHEHDGDTTADEFKAMVVELMALAGVFNIGDFIPLLKGLDLQGVVAKMKKLHQRFDAFFSSILDDHKINYSNGTKNHMDLLSTLISLKVVDNGEGVQLTDTEIKALLLVCFSIFNITSISILSY